MLGDYISQQKMPTVKDSGKTHGGLPCSLVITESNIADWNGKLEAISERQSRGKKVAKWWMHSVCWLR